jgi:hypothetical protein
MPFDNTYNTAERNYFHTAIKYHRDDDFLCENVLDEGAVAELDGAWGDLLTAFDYHDTIFRFIRDKYSLETPGETVDSANREWVQSIEYPQREYLEILLADYELQQGRLRNAMEDHIQEVLNFAEVAWRRPLKRSEEKRLKSFYARLRKEKTLSHQEAARAVLSRILVAPEFLYRIERPKGKTQIVALSDYEMASRLSYFIWSSMPDAALVQAAAQGELSSPEGLAAQVRRMLEDPKSRRLATEFFGQWFGFYRFDGYAGIDTGRFAFFDQDLKNDLYEESIRFFEYLLTQDRPVDEILSADYTFLNARLAEHYNIPWKSDTGEWLLREGLGLSNRGGLLRLGSVLAITSAPLRTSAVKRGDWVLRRVLGTPTPPPPADVGSIPAEEVLPDGNTVRERLEAHRSDASCVNCHTKIDPLGFALETYNPVGQWRDAYADGGKIDTTGILEDGTEIADFDGLLKYLERERTTFRRNLCRKLLGYALGRSEMISDRLLIDKMLDTLEDDNRFSSLITQIVTSEQFRYQRGLATGSGSFSIATANENLN